MEMKMKKWPLIALVAVWFVVWPLKVIFVDTEGTKFSYCATLETTKVVLSSGIGGNVVEVPFKEGDVIKSGDVVCRIDNTDWLIASKQVDSEFNRVSKLFNCGRGAVTQKDFEIARRQKEEIDRKLGLCGIGSPISGVITPLKEVGEYAHCGEAVASISDVSKVWGYFYVPHDMLAHLKVGDKIKCFIRNDTCDGLHCIRLCGATELEGTIVKIMTEPEFTPKNVQTIEERVRLVYGIKVMIDNQNGLINPGMDVYTCFDKIESGEAVTEGAKHKETVTAEVGHGR
jgi:HlyD family secretion protein